MQFSRHTLTHYLASLLLIATLGNARAALPEAWPAEAKEIAIPSSADGTEQPATAYMAPDDGKPKPLLVGLHTWSNDNLKPVNGANMLRWAVKQGWNFVYPNFRGPNQTPESMGSDLAVQDIVDAVRYMQKNANVDPSRIYLVGSSGGGHMALLMAGRHPEIWAGVSAWVPITDITTWYDDHSPNGKPVGYAKKIEQVLGGSPHEEKNQEEAKKRSPNTWLANAKTVPLDINHGIHDGRKGSVPFRHSLFGFNRVAAPEDQLPEAEILEFYNTQQLPAGWPVPEQDALYKKGIHFRKISGNARVTIFEGGHSIIDAAALNWLAQQRRGQPAVWKISDAVNAPSTETDSGK